MKQPLLDSEQFNEGQTLAQYFDAIPRSRGIQEKRYHAVTDDDRKPFAAVTGVPRALILTVDTCADSAWSLPRIAGLLSGIPELELRMFFREDHPELQDALLTNGKRAVPKLALLDDSNRILATWGPRPAAIQAYVNEQVAGKVERAEWFPKVLAYYRDEGIAALDEEILATVKQAARVKAGA